MLFYCKLLYVLYCVSFIEHGGLARTQFRFVSQTDADRWLNRLQTGAMDQASSVLSRIARRSEFSNYYKLLCITVFGNSMIKVFMGYVYRKKYKNVNKYTHYNIKIILTILIYNSKN